MNAKLIGALCALALLAACAEKKADTATAAGTGTGSPRVVPGSEEDFAKNAGDRVYFDFDKSLLRGDDPATLERQAAWLAKRSKVNVEIVGNCDERGTEEYDIALGQRRANAARDYLVAKGTPASRITTVSYGNERPQPDALCHDESCWWKNANAITAVK